MIISLQRRRLLQAALSDLELRARLSARLLDLDRTVIAESVRTFALPEAAADWLLTPAAGLGWRVPIEVAGTVHGRSEVIALLRRIDAGTA